MTSGEIVALLEEFYHRIARPFVAWSAKRARRREDKRHNVHLIVIILLASTIWSGCATYDPRFLDRTGPSIYWTESTSVGLFLDAGGEDIYPEGTANDYHKTDDPGSDNDRARNRGIFVDRPDGSIDLERPHGGKRPWN